MNSVGFPSPKDHDGKIIICVCVCVVTMSRSDQNFGAAADYVFNCLTYDKSFGSEEGASLVLTATSNSDKTTSISDVHRT